jgi:hypothetical protein
MPYEIRGKCIYKKDTGKKVGCTKGDVKKYLTALHMHAEGKDMKLKSIYKSVVSESEKKEKTYNGGNKIITIEVNDSEGELEKLLDWMQSMGNIGHSATIHCDVNQPSDLVEIYWDGDGSDRIRNIKIEMIPEEETQ